MKEHGIELGHVPDLGGATLPRGKVIHRAARDVIRDVCRTTGTSWSIQDGRLNLVKLDGTLPGNAVLLSPQTGLVGSPEQATKGVKAQCLLNPEIRVGGKVKIEADITEAQVKKDGGKEGKSKDESPAKLAADGVDRIIECRYRGDTWGNDWY